MTNKDKYLAPKILVLSVLVSLLIVNYMGSFPFRFRAFSFDISFSFWPLGETIVNIPPLGQLAASTHDFPLRLVIRLEEIDINTLEQMMDLPEDFYNVIWTEIRHDFFAFYLRLLLTAILTSIISAALLINKHKKTLFWAGFLTFLFITINLLGVYYFYQPAAFASPAYSGTLESAPWMMELITESLVRIEELSAKIQTMAENLYLAFEQIETLRPLEPQPENQLNLLHVSDIHNNVVALNLIEQIVNNFSIDLIIDTGDMVDYGTIPEAELATEIQELNLPYIFVPGNHDSPQVVSFLEELENVQILRRKKTVNELEIVGLPDPLSFRSEFHSPSAEEIETDIKTIEEIIASRETPPHLVAVHNHEIARGLEGKVPLILHGHTHSKDILTTGESIRINAGTTGASGIRSLETTSGTPPYTMVLLRLQQEEDTVTLRAVDTIRINDTDQGFILKRYLVNRKLTQTENNLFGSHP